MREVEQSAGDWPKPVALSILAGVLVVAMYLYYPALYIGFMLDDWSDVSSAAVMTLSQWWTYTFSPIAQEWRAMTWLFWGILYRLFGYDTFYHHMAHIATHLLNTVLVFFLARRLGNYWLSAILAAAFFSWNQALVSPVAWNSATIDQILVLFGIPTLLVYIRATSDLSPGEALRGRVAWGGMVAAYFCFYCMLKAKPMAITFPGVLVAYELFYRTPQWSPKGLIAFAKRIIVLHWPMWVMLGFYLVAFRRYLGGSIPRDGEYGITVSFSQYFSSIAWYLPHATMNWTGAPDGTLLATIAAIVVAWKWRSRAIAMGIVWFYLTIIPVALLTIHHFDHHLYLPMVGIAIVVGGVLGRVLLKLGSITPLFARWRVATVLTMSLLALFLWINQPPIRLYIHSAHDGYQKALKTLASFKSLLPSLPEAQVEIYVFPRPSDGLFAYPQSVRMLYDRYQKLNVTVIDDEAAFKTKVHEIKVAESTPGLQTKSYAFRYTPETGLLQAAAE